MTETDSRYRGLSVLELRAFAAGYLEALADQRPEWERWGRQVAVDGQELETLRHCAEIYYHAAFCDCPAARRARRTTPLMHHHRV